MFTNNKKWLSVAIDISQLLYNNQCTFDETEKILQFLQSEFKQQRENYEYDTVDDFISRNKSRYANDIIIQPLHHLNGFC